MGELFSPHRKFREMVLIPAAVVADPDLSPGAKLCYGRLLRYGGKKNHCWPAQETLARELGVSVPTVKRYLAELKTQRYIVARRRGLGESNLYYFVWHARFGALVATSDGSKTIPQERSKLSPEESQGRGSTLHDNDSLPFRAGLSTGGGIPEYKPEDLALVKQSIANLMGREPDDQIVHRTLAAGGDSVSAGEICKFLLDLCQRRKPYDRRSKGPRSMGWFPTVVKQHFDQERAMERAASDPTTPKHWSQYRTEINPKFAEALEALELPDAPGDVKQPESHPGAVVGREQHSLDSNPYSARVEKTR